MPDDYTLDIARGDRQRLPSSDSADWFVLRDPSTGDPLDLTNRSVEFALTTRYAGGERIALTNSVEYGTLTAGEVAITLAPADTAVPLNGQTTTLYGEFRVVDGPEDPTTDPVADEVQLTIHRSRGDVSEEATLLSFGALSDLLIDVAKDWAGQDIRNVGAIDLERVDWEPIPEPDAPASGWTDFVDEADGKRKTKHESGEVVTISSPPE